MDGFWSGRSSDGTDETCSFTQGHGIYSMEKTLFVLDVTTGCIKLASAQWNYVVLTSPWNSKCL